MKSSFKKCSEADSNNWMYLNKMVHRVKNSIVNISIEFCKNFKVG